MCHSEKTLWKFLRLDYSGKLHLALAIYLNTSDCILGIAALIVGSYFAPIFYGYYCFPLWQAVYLTCMGITGVTLVILSLFDFFHSNRYQHDTCKISFIGKFVMLQ